MNKEFLNKKQENSEEERKIYEKPSKELILILEKNRKKDQPPAKPIENMPKIEFEEEEEEDKKEQEEETSEEGEEEKEQEEEGASEEEGEEKNDEDENEIEEDNPWEPLIETPSPINRKTIEDFINFQKEKEKELEKKLEEEERIKRLTPKERARKAQKEEDENFIKEYFKNEEDINKFLEIAEEYRQIEESVEPYIEDLARVFEQVMQSISQQITFFWEEGWRSGRFNIDRFIKKYAAYIQEGAPPLSFDQLDVYDQRDFIKRLKLFPEKIKVRLVLDGSGSMTGDRIIALKQIAVLIIEALSAFEFSINFRFKLKNPIRIDTEIRMFGSRGNSKIIKPFSETENYNPTEERVNRLKAFQFIHSNYGDTCDAEAWWKINESLNKKLNYLEDLKKGRAREFVFEVTDGGSNQSTQINISPAQDTRDAIEAVEKKGVVTRGFQIGDPDSEERMIFDRIWGEKGSRIDHLKDLAPAITKTLADEIKKFQFRIQYEEDSDIEE